MMPSKLLPSVHARCCEVDVIDGSTVMCGKSKGHDAPTVEDETRREHYDPSAEVRWPAKPKRVRKSKRCGAYYGTGEGGAVCVRAVGHPPVSEDGTGHSDQESMRGK